MVICNCRNIRESQFPNREELIARILEDDYSCGTCLDDFLPDANQKGIDTANVTVYK
jgi:hypothetical protein